MKCEIQNKWNDIIRDKSLGVTVQYIDVDVTVQPMVEILTRLKWENTWRLIPFCEETVKAPIWHLTDDIGI
jgi:hypothetical protein